MKKQYLLEMSEQEREYLHKLISSGSAPARKLNRARILLKADVVGKHAEAQALSDRPDRSDALKTSIATVQRERANASTREVCKPPWNALSPIGSTSAL